MAKNKIKLVRFKDSDYEKPSPRSGGGKKSFKVVTDQFRQALVGQLGRVKEEVLSSPFSRVGVAIVELEDKALAKSHRPVGIFNEKTCPFIGDVGFGAFLIEVSEGAIEALQKRILTAKGTTLTPQISTIKEIKPYSVELVDDYGSEKSLLVRLFRMHDAESDWQSSSGFEAFLEQHEFEFERLEKSGVLLYRISWAENQKSVRDAVSQIASYSTVAKILPANSVKVAPMVLSDMAMEEPKVLDPDPEKKYPIVAVVDTSVKADCPYIAPWVEDVKHFVQMNQSYNHATFVSGLISNSWALNGKDDRFPKSQSKVINVEVLDNQGGNFDEIIAAMEEVANEHPEVKVWNLSLGESASCSLSTMSDFAILLDAFQQKHGVLCVVAAGNKEYSKLDDGRISAPGDSALALTVASLAHVSGQVEAGQPSPFSRCGPVSNFLKKPDVSHYGGNFSDSGMRLGVNSISERCSLADDIGTSFSAPLVSTIAANLFDRLGVTSSPEMVKALIIHSAQLSFGKELSSEQKLFFGHGVPEDADEILSVEDNEITFAMEGQTKKGFELTKLPFPVPECLRTGDGKVKGEFFVTLVYNPPLDPQSTMEYCQVNIEIGLGKLDEQGKFRGMIPPEQAHEYERDLVKKGYKWSPIKVHYKAFPQGATADDWKLRVTVSNREGFDYEGEEAIPFALILTLRAFDEEAPVYSEMIRLMEQEQWDAVDLEQGEVVTTVS